MLIFIQWEYFFLIPKNPPPQLEGNFSKGFKEFVALCLQKDPEERPTAKDLLKHRFIKGAKKTNCLVELIERRQRWLQVVGNQDSGDESEKEPDNSEDGSADWDFDTVRGKSSSKPSTSKSKKEETQPKEEVQKSEVLKNPSISNLQADARPSRSQSDPPKFDSVPVKSKNTSTTPTTTTPTNNNNNGSSSNSTTAIQPAAKTNDQSRPSALTSVIYPVLSKLLKSNQEEAVIAALAQLKIAFDNAERAKPGITHSLIAQIIETLKR